MTNIKHIPIPSLININPRTEGLYIPQSLKSSATLSGLQQRITRHMKMQEKTLRRDKKHQSQYQIRDGCWN